MTNNVTLLDVKDRAPNEDLVEMLGRLLEYAKAGQLRACMTVCQWDEGGVSHGWRLDPRHGNRAIIGELAMAQYNILTAHALVEDDSRLAGALYNT